MKLEFESESWEQTGPSYIQSYVVSAFILIGVLSIAFHQVPVTPMALIFFSLWFGTAFYWLIQNRYAEKTFASDRITVANGKVSHTFRYTITEAEFSEIDVDAVTRMKVHSGTPIAVELIGPKESDFFFLPNEMQVERLRAVLQQLNPDIQFTR